MISGPNRGEASGSVSQAPPTPRLSDPDGVGGQVPGGRGAGGGPGCGRTGVPDGGEGGDGRRRTQSGAHASVNEGLVLR